MDSHGTPSQQKQPTQTSIIKDYQKIAAWSWSPDKSMHCVPTVRAESDCGGKDTPNNDVIPKSRGFHYHKSETEPTCWPGTLSHGSRGLGIDADMRLRCGTPPENNEYTLFTGGGERSRADTAKDENKPYIKASVENPHKIRRSLKCNEDRIPIHGAILGNQSSYY